MPNAIADYGKVASVLVLGEMGLDQNVMVSSRTEKIICNARVVTESNGDIIICLKMQYYVCFDIFKNELLMGVLRIELQYFNKIEKPNNLKKKYYWRKCWTTKGHSYVFHR